MLEQVLMWKNTLCVSLSLSAREKNTLAKNVPVFFSLAYKLMLSHNVSFHINTCSNILLHKPELAKNVPVFFSLSYKQNTGTFFASSGL
jgi:hypothetical protein